MAAEMIDWLYGLQHFGIKLGIQNIAALLELLGHPEKSYRTAHIAGTNGKGSVAAMIDAMLTAAGKRTGLYTSPHLVRPNERIRLLGRDIDDAELDRRLRAMRTRIQGALRDGILEAHPSFFEVMTATALDAFRDSHVDAGILEVGLGGRLDATNAVHADVGAIVSIGLDHVKTLGPTLEKIAAEKAGIIKRGMPVVCGPVVPVVSEVLDRACRERGAERIDAFTRIQLASGDEDGFSLLGQHGPYRRLKVALPGPHQVGNARVAIAVYESLLEAAGEQAEEGAIREGLRTVRWPGRLQWVDRGEHQPRVLLDGAHNPEGIACVASHLRAHPLDTGSILLFGATNGKPLDQLLAPLAPFCRTIVVSRPPVERGLDPDEVAAEARPLFDRVEIAMDTAAALKTADQLAGKRGTVLVTGSLYLVGEVLGLLEQRPVPGPVAM